MRAPAEIAYPVLGCARDYGELHRIVRLRADQIDTPRLILDEMAGVSAGYMGKLLAPTPMRRLGPSTLGPVLHALGLRLIVVADDQNLDRQRDQLPVREARNVRHYAT